MALVRFHSQNSTDSYSIREVFYKMCFVQVCRLLLVCRHIGTAASKDSRGLSLSRAGRLCVTPSPDPPVESLVDLGAPHTCQGHSAAPKERRVSKSTKHEKAQPTLGELPKPEDEMLVLDSSADVILTTTSNIRRLIGEPGVFNTTECLHLLLRCAMISDIRV